MLSKPQPEVCRRGGTCLYPSLSLGLSPGRSGEWRCPSLGTYVSLWAGRCLGSLDCGCGSLRMQRCCRLCRCVLSSSNCFFLASSWVTMHRSHKPARSLGTGEAIPIRADTLVPPVPLLGEPCPFPTVSHGPPRLPPAEGLAVRCNYVWKGILGRRFS